MAEALILGQPLKFWAEDNIRRVSNTKMGREAESLTYRDMFVKFVTHAYEQKGEIAGLTRGNIELKELGRESAGRIEVLTFKVGIRDEVLNISPGKLAAYIVRLEQELEELKATEVLEQAADGRERQAGIDKLGVKLALAQSYQEVVGPFVQELTEATAAVERGAEELEAAQKQFGEEAQALQDRIEELEREGIPAHTDEIGRLKLALQEKTKAFAALEIQHRELVDLSGEEQERLGAQVELLEKQVEEARRTQVTTEQALLGQQSANNELKVEHARLLGEAEKVAGEREKELQKLLDEASKQNDLFAERVRLLEAAPEAVVQNKADMLDRVAVVVLGTDPDLGLLEARVGEHIQAEGRLAQLYQLAKLPADSFAALSNVIQALGRIFVAFGYDAEQNYEVSVGQHEGNVAEINRKADDYGRVELERANAVRDLGIAQLDLVREQANSKKLLSILGNGFSWTWSTMTAFPRFIYDAMRF
ncbi:hypothetical protein [Candidatus Neptunichlamydia sp. REUL1]|uniref:hypothetical protein n=1 Tax=Candidatus Neptunichlamydia sp. REUL1 TaxID=3064277 RepID=UPI00292E8D7E|nr:hypothetical protein [Candidatus Neptunochlamydia sp. REUL1]